MRKKFYPTQPVFKAIGTRNGAQGFTLLEMMLAMGLFLVIGGTAFGLVSAHVPLFAQQQNQSGMNITLRNAVTQIQNDVVNAGSGFYPGINIPAWPVGVTIQNNTGGAACHTTGTTTYNAACFDTMNVITSDQNTPAAPPDNSASGCANTVSGSVWLKPIAPTTAAALALDYKSGDQILLVNGTGQMSSVVLTSAGSAVATAEGQEVKLTFAATNANGTNTTAHDPLSITTTSDDSDNQITNSFCPATSYVLRLTPVTYSVNTTSAADPQLIRTEAGSSNVIADQIIGLKIGAMIFNDATVSDNQTYNFDASDSVASGGYNNNFTRIRAIMVSLIGRTAPIANSNFTNAFDGGPYRIEAMDVVINPRNLSMNDNDVPNVQ